MDRARWQRVGEIFEAVSGLEGEALARALDEHCGDDAGLRREVASLLEADTDAEAWLAGLTARSGIPAPEAEAALNAPGRTIGAWRLVRMIGRGGMGVVYLAERADGQFRMQAALKALPVGLITREAVGRFQREREILAQLDHPHIARLLDGGVTPEGTPFYVMEYVAGLPLHRYCQERAPSLDARLRLFEQIGSAVAYAHRHLVIHRDIKPANILVTLDGESKLLDFGVAKLVDVEAPDTATATQAARRRVTPAYTAPELLQGMPATTACDVYSLGVVLYELLAGAPPFEPGFFDAPGWTDRLAGYRPPPPSKAAKDGALRSRLQGDMDTIVAMAMHPDPGRRYATVNALLKDLECHRKRLPVAARPDTLGYRASRFVRRHVVGVGLSTAVIFAVLAGFASTSYYAVQASRQAAQVAEERDRAKSLQEFLLELFRASEPVRPKDELPTTEEILALGAKRAMQEEAASASERVGMLLTMGEVYLAQKRFEQARPLIEEAVSLAREYREERPADLAEALSQKAQMAMDQEQYGDAEALLSEAESVLGAEQRPWSTYASVRSQRGYLQILEGKREEALELLEPLYAAMQKRQRVNERLRYDILNPLAIAYRIVGELEAAARINDQLLESARSLYEPDSLRYAILLANSANTERDLGRLELAEERLRKALDLYDEIFSKAAVYRAAARHNLSRTLLYQGRFENSLDQMAASSREWAIATDRVPGEWVFYFLNQGMVLVRMHRWAEAQDALVKARALLEEESQYGPEIGAHADALLAISLCRTSQIEAGRSVLKELEARINGEMPSTAEYRARVHEARAICSFRAGKPVVALNEATKGLKALNQPGRAVEMADLMILRARIHAGQQRNRQAAAELNRARELFMRLELPNHPSLSRIEQAREDLSL